MLRAILVVLGIAALLLIVLLAVGIYIHLHWHSESAETRRAIAAEARVAMRYAPVPARDTMPEAIDLAALSAGVPRDSAPRILMGLEPEQVLAEPDGVYVVMRGFFVGRSGYFVPRGGRAPKDRVSLSYTALGDGVWWYVDEG